MRPRLPRSFLTKAVARNRTLMAFGRSAVYSDQTANFRVSLVIFSRLFD